MAHLGNVMGNQHQIEEYLSKAKEAEALAAAFPDTDSFMKSSWLTIARGYRELAEGERAKGSSSAQASPASPTEPQT